MSTFGALRDRIADELGRADLTPQIEQAIRDAVDHYTIEPWWFLEHEDTVTTVLGEPIIALPDDFEKMLHTSITITTERLPMRERTWEWYRQRSWNSVSSGHPRDFAVFAGQLHLWPPPSGEYPVTFSYIRRFPALEATADTNPWMVEGERLIRAWVKCYLLIDVLRDDTGEAERQKAITREMYAQLRRRSETRRVVPADILPQYF